MVESRWVQNRLYRKIFGRLALPACGTVSAGHHVYQDMVNEGGLDQAGFHGSKHEVVIGSNRQAGVEKAGPLSDLAAQIERRMGRHPSHAERTPPIGRAAPPANNRLGLMVSDEIQIAVNNVMRRQRLRDPREGVPVMIAVIGIEVANRVAAIEAEPLVHPEKDSFIGL